jgi:predicted membrane protein
MKKQTARRNICSYSSSDGIFIIIFFTFIAYVLLWPAPLLAAALFATSRNCSALAIFFLVIKLVTLLSCSSCIGCWLMEDSIMAPILNFYGTSPAKSRPKGKERRKRRKEEARGEQTGDRAGKTSRLNYGSMKERKMRSSNPFRLAGA